METNGSDGVGCHASVVSAKRTKSETCSNCGRTVETGEWHPVVANDDGDRFRIHAFCDERCRDTWVR